MTTICTTAQQRSAIAGKGSLEVSFVQGQSVVTKCYATDPLKLLVPKRDNRAAWAYVSSYGGGMVGGDEIELDVQVNNNAIAVLGTQASTKIYKDLTGRGCKQLIRARVADQATLVAVPDPVTCYRAAAFDQTQSIYLQGDASLVLVDWVTSGRRDAGEIWDFSQYRSSIEIYLDEQLQLLDTILLNSKDGALTAEYRLGRFHCLATVILAGPKMIEFGETITAELKKEEPTQRGQLIESMSPFDHGFVLRILGETTEMTSNRLKLRLGFLKTLLDETPWDRKW